MPYINAMNLKTTPLRSFVYSGIFQHRNLSKIPEFHFMMERSIFMYSKFGTEWRVIKWLYINILLNTFDVNYGVAKRKGLHRCRPLRYWLLDLGSN